MQKRIQALGRLKAGVMNKTEKAYASFLRILLFEQEILWYKWEGIKFRLADRTYYEPDFAIMKPDGSIEIHEVKGAKAIFADDARVKIKVCAEQYPFRFFAVYPKNSGWEYEEFNAN